MVRKVSGKTDCNSNHIVLVFCAHTLSTMFLEELALCLSEKGEDAKGKMVSVLPRVAMLVSGMVYSHEDYNSACGISQALLPLLQLIGSEVAVLHRVT